MTTLRNVLVFLILCMAAFGQNATVIGLPQADAIQAKQLYNAKIDADKAWDKFSDKVQADYPSFYSGVDFSADFRFIVPKAYQNSCYTCYTGTSTTWCDHISTVLTPAR